MTYILVIEDDAPTNSLLKRILERANYTVVCVFTATEGLEIALATPPQLAIVDIRLPHMDGFLLVEQFKAQPTLQNIPIIALTADHSNAARDKSVLVGCDVFMGKPFSRDELLEQVEQLVAQTQS